MRKFFVAIIITFSFIKCTPEDRKIPKEILPLDTMKVVVWNLIEAGDYATSLKAKDSTIKSINTMYMAQVLQLHHLDKKTFFNSFNFYEHNLYFNKILFDSINAYASRQRNEVYKFNQ